MGLLKVIFLSVVQGITEFLPVSSTGHLVLFEQILGLPAESREMLLFDLVTHLGTVIAVLVVFRESLFRSIGLRDSLGDNDAGVLDATRPAQIRRIVLMVLVATVVTCVVAFPMRIQLARARGNLTVVALMWIITGTLLCVTDRMRSARSDLMEFGFKGAALVGVAQAFAAMPGISRSGATICVAVLAGLHRASAVKFSFLIGVPVILLATMFEVASQWNRLGINGVPVWSLALGCVVAALVGIGSLKGLLWASKSRRLKYFGFYCYVLAGAVLVYSLTQ